MCTVASYSYCMNSTVAITRTVNINICLFTTAEPVADDDIKQQLAPIQQLGEHSSEGHSAGLTVGQQSKGQSSVVSPLEQILSPQNPVWLTVMDLFPLYDGLILRQQPRKQPIHLGQRPGVVFASGCCLLQ